MANERPPAGKWFFCKSCEVYGTEKKCWYCGVDIDFQVMYALDSRGGMSTASFSEKVSESA